MKNKIKLIAIAKDEAAYLPAWIFHHLYFGFDEIDVYINNTTDNTHELEAALSHNTQVNFIDGDQFFKEGLERPQEAVYLSAYKQAKVEKFTHVLFIDIDEFWTPKNFKDSIQDCLKKVGGDVISFEWFNKQSEANVFSSAYQNTIEGIKGRFVKSLCSLNVEITNIGVHNVISPNAKYKLADGSAFNFTGKMNGRIPPIKGPAKLKDYFVMHRMYRSQMEYVSLLGRGRPSHAGSLFKNNRPGYCVHQNVIEFKPNTTLLAQYDDAFQAFLEQYKIKPTLIVAQEFVKSRYEGVLKLIESAPVSELKTLKKLLANVTLRAVQKSFNSFKSSKLTLKEVEVLRDLAIKLEKSNIQDAYQLMLIAQKHRPQGRTINKKIIEYELILNINNKLNDE